MNAHRFDHLLSFVIEQPWAITRPMLSIVAGILGRRLAGGPADPVELRPAPSTTRRPGAPAASSVAVIPIHGVIAPRMNLLSDISGGTSYQAIRLALRLAVDDPAVKSIVLDIDSPGGSVAGASECALAILAARQRKPITAVAEYQACSAAYWLASCATELVASPSAQVGSIGVYTVHEDLSKALEQLGVAVTVVSAGKYKTEALPVAPLSAEAKARIQRQVNQAYGMFVRDVARGRGVTEASVRGGFGEGAVVSADEALRGGMVNRLECLEDCLTRVVAAPPPLVPVRQLAAVRTESAGPSRLDYFRQQMSVRALRGAHAMGPHRPH